MQGVSKAEEIAEEFLKRYKGDYVSRRDGFVIVKYRENNETVVAWIRQRPVTREALELFKKIIRRHEYDKLVLVKLYRSADYIKYSELKIFNEIRTVA